MGSSVNLIYFPDEEEIRERGVSTIPRIPITKPRKISYNSFDYFKIQALLRSEDKPSPEKDKNKKENAEPDEQPEVSASNGNKTEERRYILRKTHIPKYLEDYVDPQNSDIANYTVDYCHQIRDFP